MGWQRIERTLKIRDQRGKGKFPVVPLSLDGTKLGVLEEIFGDEPIYISVSSGAGGVEEPMNAILEELVLELTDLKLHEQDGVRRAAARARLV